MPDVLLWRNTHQTILKFFDPAVPDFHCKKSQTAGSGSESFSYHTGFHLSLKPLCCFRLKSKHRDLPICYKNKRCGIVPLRKPEFYAFLHYSTIDQKEQATVKSIHNGFTATCSFLFYDLIIFSWRDCKDYHIEYCKDCWYSNCAHHG